MPLHARTTLLGLLGLCLLLPVPALAAPADAARVDAAAARAQHRHANGAHRAQRHARAERRERRAARRQRAARRRLAARRAASPRLFAADSVWNRPLAPGAPLDPTSRALVKALADEAAREAAALTGPWISTTEYSTPVYVVGPDQPRVRVALDDPSVAWRASLARAFAAVPIPAGARAARGTDAQLTVYQPSTDRLWEFWKIRKGPDGWRAAWGGAIERVSRSPGYYTRDAWTGAGPHWGASASSLPLVAGTMMLDELRAGRIGHALAMEVPFPRRGVYAWPAQRTDGRGTSPLDLPEGARLRLDPALDVRALRLPPIVEQMALAAQRYGIVVRDQSLNSIGFYAEDPTPTGTSPYYGRSGLFRGKWPSELLARFPWRSLQVLKLDLRNSFPS